MEVYPSDKAPQLTKNSFAIMKSAPSNDRGEHWIMIVRLVKTNYFDSLGRNRTTYSSLTKKTIDEWFPENYKKRIICVIFTHYIQHFFFLISAKETDLLDNV